jgi:predicted nucleic acid-binding protein
MMRVLLDINVILDVLADREPFVDDAEAVLRRVEARAMEGLVAAHTITTLHLLLAKHLGKAKVRKVLTDLLHVVTVVPVDEDRVRHALALNWTDFEYAVQAACAENAEAEYLVTRDKKGFKKSPVKVVTPAELLALVS